MFFRIVIIFFSLLMLLWQSVFALNSDKDQPITLDADNFEIDLKTGVRIYRGNMSLRQGSIRLNCDKLITYYDNDTLNKAVCTGKPIRFRLRPESSENDIVGTARKFTMDEIQQEIILKTQAKIVHGDIQISGQVILYNLATEQIKVKGRDSSSATSEKFAAGLISDTLESLPEAVETELSRPSLVIQPRTKKKHMMIEKD